MSAASPILLVADLTNQKLRTDLGGSDFVFPRVMQRSRMRLRFRFSEQIASTHVERYPAVREIRATVGQLDLRPEAGVVSFKVGTATSVIGTNVTADLAFDFSPTDLQTALNALSNESGVVVVEDDDSFVITGLSAAIKAEKNTLRPISFARVHSYSVNSTTTQAIRLQRAPFAFTDQFAQEVPPGPSITRIAAGGTADGVEYPEIQKLTTPREFAGSYRIFTANDVHRSPLLGIGDGPEEVQAAINPAEDGSNIGLATDSAGVFTVTEHPTEPAMFIEFGGSMLGSGQSLLKAVVFDAPPGDFEIELDFDTAAMAEAFRETDEIKVPFEIFADFEDPDDAEVVDTDVPVYLGELTIKESITHDDLGTAANIDYLEPPAAKTYLPVSPDSLTSGTRFYEFLLGDGTATGPFAIAHNLDSPRTKVHLRANTADGASLIEGTDFSVVYNDDDQLTITLLGTYAADPLTSNELAGTVQDLTLTSTWLAHTHTIAEVTGLQAILDTYGAAIAALQAVAPGALGRVATLTGSYRRERAIPSFGEAYPLPARSSLLFVPGQRIVDLSSGDLPERRRAPKLFPAVHDAVADALPTTGAGLSIAPAIPTSDDVGKIFQNQTGGSIFLSVPGGYTLPAQGFAATDGVTWFPMVQYGTGESSYYPALLERDLFSETIEETDLVSGRIYEAQFALGLAALVGNTSVYTHVQIQIAQLTADTTPGTPGGNIAEEAYVETPVLDQRVTLTAMPIEDVYGYRVTRATNGDLTAEKLVFGRWTAATAPATARFAVRARLARFDMENSVTDPRGIIAYSGPRFDQGSTSQSGAGVGVSVIR